MRACGLCGRDVHDPDEHDLVVVPVPNSRRKHRYHVCKNMVTIAEQSARDLVTGERRVIKRYVPTKTVGDELEVIDIQRTAQNRTRSIHKDALAAQELLNA